MTDYQRLIRECAMSQKVYHIIERKGDMVLVETRKDVEYNLPRSYEVYVDGRRVICTTSYASAMRHWKALYHG